MNSKCSSVRGWSNARKGACVKECRQPLEAEKETEEPPEEPALPTAQLQPSETDFRLQTNLLNYKIINFCYLSQ